MEEFGKIFLEDQKFVVDLSKPIVQQVGYLGDAYQDWVHSPIVSKVPPRFFEDNIAEFFTRTKWWVIPAVWLPVAVLLESEALKNGYTLKWIPLTMFLGAFAWTFIEYLLHRFIFHMNTSGFWSNTLHYVIHGFHHKHPMDGSRLVFPPAFTLPIVLAIWGFLSSIMLPYPFRSSVFGGGLVMYVIYDLTHYYLHFGMPLTDYHRKLKKYHLNHHFKVQTDGFGVTSTFWDWVFGTLPNNKQSGTE